MIPLLLPSKEGLLKVKTSTPFRWQKLMLVLTVVIRNGVDCFTVLFCLGYFVNMLVPWHEDNLTKISICDPCNPTGTSPFPTPQKTTPRWFQLQQKNILHYDVSLRFYKWKSNTILNILVISLRKWCLDIDYRLFNENISNLIIFNIFMF